HTHTHTHAPTRSHTHTPAGSLLDPLVAVQDALEQLGHEGLEVQVRRLADHPVGVAAQRLAGDGANQGIPVRHTLDQVGDQVRQVGDHTLHASYRDRESVCVCVCVCV